MKAFCITEPGSFNYIDLAHPLDSGKKLGPDEVLLKIRFIGFCGTDLNTFRGKNPMVSFPRVPGHEIAAIVEQIGTGVPSTIKTGDMVTVNPYTNCGHCASCRRGRVNACQTNQTLGVQRDGAMTEYIVVPWQRIVMAPALELRRLALVEPFSVGAHALARSGLASRKAGGPKHSVCVFGCGAIGLGVIASAAWFGNEVIAVDIDDEKLNLAQRLGATHLINNGRDKLHDKLVHITGDGPDVIIEAIGLPQTFVQAVEEVAFSGTVVYVGYAKDPVTYESKLFVQKELDIRGSRNALQGDFVNVVEMLAQPAFPADAVISRVVPLVEAGAALKEWSEKPQTITKILVEI